MSRYVLILSFAMLACTGSYENVGKSGSDQTSNTKATSRVESSRGIEGIPWDTPPRLIHAPRLKVDKSLIEAEDNVFVRIHITTEGIVDTAWIEQSQNYPTLDSLALDYVHGFVFAPAKKDGQAIAAMATWPFQFRIPINGID